MNKEQIRVLDELLLTRRKMNNSKELKFDIDGRPISRIVSEKEKIIDSKIKNHVLQHGPKILYRYRKGSEYDIQNLKDDVLWLSTLKEYNDPFEDRIYIDFKAIADDLVKKNSMLNSFNSIFPDNKLYKTYLNNVFSNGQKLLKELDVKKNRAFIACFSETNKSLLMWAHYADCHKGFCIGYSFDSLINEYGINIFPVTYSNEFLIIDSYEKFVDHHDVFIKAIKRKSEEWAYEKEWRFFGEYMINEPYRAGVSKKTPKPVCMYLGVNIDKQIKNDLMVIGREKGIDIYQMRMSDKAYRLLSYKC